MTKIRSTRLALLAATATSFAFVLAGPAFAHHRHHHHHHWAHHHHHHHLIAAPAPAAGPEGDLLCGPGGSAGGLIGDTFGCGK